VNATEWPNHCAACRGWGVHSWNEFVPYGMGSAAMPMSEPCEGCAAAGNCARCGQPGLTSEDRGDETTGDGPCGFCGWNYDDGIEEDWPDDDGGGGPWE